MDEKPLIWVGSAREDLRRFPIEARRRSGFELDLVQRGRLPSDWRPMPTVGPGVVEIRIHESGEHRVFFVARFSEAVYVLHAFEKKSEKTPRRHIETARARLADVVSRRRHSGKDPS